MTISSTHKDSMSNLIVLLELFDLMQQAEDDYFNAVNHSELSKDNKLVRKLWTRWRELVCLWETQLKADCQLIRRRNNATEHEERTAARTSVWWRVANG